MKKTLLVAICLIALFAGCKSEKKEESPKRELKVGIVLPLTGELANFGNTILNGVKIGLKEFNTSDSLHLSLVIEDSKADATTAVSAFNKLTDVDKVSVVIGDLTSGATLAMAPIANAKKVLLISPSASNPKLSDAGPFFSRVWPSDNLDGKVAAYYCRDSLKLRRMAVIYLNNDYCLGLKDVFTEEFQKRGGEIAGIDGYVEGQTNFRAILLKVKGTNVDGLYIPGYPLGIASILKQAKEMGLNTVFFSNVASEDKDFANLAGNAAIGLMYTAPTFDPASNDPATKSFVDKFEREFHSKPDVHALKGYEVISLVSESIRNGASNPDQIRSFIQQRKIFHVAGETLTFDEHGDVTAPVSVKRYSSLGVQSVISIVKPY